MPSSESSSGKMAEPADLAAFSNMFLWPVAKSDAVGGLFMAPSRGPGVKEPEESCGKEEKV